MVHVRHLFDMGVDPFVDPFDFLHCLRYQIDVERRERAADALSRVTAAEIRPAIGSGAPVTRLCQAGFAAVLSKAIGF
jgi:hypothetical protein